MDDTAANAKLAKLEKAIEELTAQIDGLAPSERRRAEVQALPSAEPFTRACRGARSAALPPPCTRHGAALRSASRVRLPMRAHLSQTDAVG